MEEPRLLISQTLANIQSASDLYTIHKISNASRHISETRQKQRQDTRQTLRSLSRQLELAKANAERPAGAQDEFQHSNTMVELDREKFSLAKNINELEQSVASLDAQLARLKEEWNKGEEEQVEDEFPVDQTVLKLKICRSLGFDLVEDEAGIFTKAIIRKLHFLGRVYANQQARIDQKMSAHLSWTASIPRTFTPIIFGICAHDGVTCTVCNICCFRE